MQQEFYLDDRLEKDLEIEFADAPRVTQEYVRKLERRLDEAAIRLGAETREVEVPRKGFLAKPLTQRQRQFINSMLTPKIAIANVLQQEDLKKVPIDDCGEKMIALPEVFDQRGIDVTFTRSRFHLACGKSAGRQRIWHMRESAAHKLVQLFSVLNKIGIRPNMEDAFRPGEVQEGLFIRRIVEVAQQNPAWNDHSVMISSRSFTASVPGLAGHMAGAAVDVRFKTIGDDTFLGLTAGDLYQLGNGYPEGSAIACIDNPYITGEQFFARQQFAHIMRMGGFKILRTENWHASHGDRGLGFDSHAHSIKSIYGPIRSFDPDTGKVEAWGKRDRDISFLDEDEIHLLIAEARKETEGGMRKPLDVIDSFRKLQWERRQVTSPEA